MEKIIKLDQLVELAMEVEVTDPLPWHLVNVDPKTAYSMMAAHVIDLIENDTSADREIVMLSVMTKLLVENFILQTKIAQDNR